MDELGQLVVVENRLVDRDLSAGLLARMQQIGLGTDIAPQTGDDLFPDRIQRRVGDLGELLREVIEQQPRASRKHSNRSVGTHRSQCFAAGLGHRRDQHVQVFEAVAEDLLPDQHPVVRHVHMWPVRQIGQMFDAVVQPLLIGMFEGEVGFDLVVTDDPTLGGVDQEHPSRLQPHLLDDLGWLDIEHTDLGSHHDQAVLGNPHPAGPQSVSIEDRTDHRAIGEAHRGRTVPRLHQHRVILVERP